MYLIRRPLSWRMYRSREKYAYFECIDDFGMRHYGAKKKAYRFRTREQARTFLRDKLGNREDHEIVKE